MKTAFPETVKILAGQIAEARVDHAAFEVLLRPCEMSRCKATCCYDGVHVSDEEAGYIRKMVRGKFSGVLDFESVIVSTETGRGQKTATRVAEDGELAEDFPEHFARTRCVFLDREGYCGLQKLAMAEGVDAWRHKPLTCWMHPLVLIPAGKWEERPVLTLVNAENDPQRSKFGEYAGYASCTHCGREDAGGRPAWEGLEAELRYLGELCGRDVYGELSAEEVEWERE